MTITPAAGTPGAAANYPPVAGLIAFAPKDGLFLRAEHLAAIQDYSRSLATAVGRAGGAGVVYGCTASIPDSDGRIEVSQGLAIAPTGQPLLVTRPVSKALPQAGAERYLVVELSLENTPTGTPEQIFGLLCEDPCGNGESFRPYVAEGVRIQFRPPNYNIILPAASSRQLRSAVASAYFEGERRHPPLPLLPTSERDPGKHAELESPDWSTGTGPSAPGGVPVGLLIRDGNEWVLDVWAARRDRIEPPPERGWLRRTGGRPQDVFLAQVLQLQAHLVDLDIPNKVRSGAVVTLPEHLVELPPAGYLPIDPSSMLAVEDQVRRLLGPGLDLRFCTARPDEIRLALERARHLDRIPLSDSNGQGGKPKVDVLIPDGTPATRSVPSFVRFAAWSVAVTQTRRGSKTNNYNGLARLRHISGGEVTLAFAAAGPSVGNAPLNGLWLALQLKRSPFEMKPTDTAYAEINLAIHQTRRVAVQQLGLRGTLQCTNLQWDPATRLPTFDGQFYGTFRTGESGKPLTDYPAVTLSVGLTLSRESASTLLLRIELDEPTLAITAKLEVRIKQRESGGWEVTFETNPALRDRLRFELTSKLDEIPAAGVLGNAARWNAERGLAALGATDIPKLAVDLLLSGASPQRAVTGYATPHDWVFFTRRHLLDCTPLVDPDAPDIRMDLYVETTQIAEVQTKAPVLLWITQLSWSPDMLVLSQQSTQELTLWQQAHSGLVPTGARAWLDGVQASVIALVKPVMELMGATSKEPIEEKTGQRPEPRPGSLGAIVVTVAQS